MDQDPHGISALDALEERVLGVLIEKALATPDQYPLSLHALTAGCNQKSNRDPEMLVSEPEARLTLDGLRMKRLAGVTHPAGGRVERYVHSAAETLGLPRPSLAVLAELLLRGPQARGELRARASRMEPIESLGDLAETIERLKLKGLVEEHPPAPGSRAPRVGHTLGAGGVRGGGRVREAGEPGADRAFVGAPGVGAGSRSSLSSSSSSAPGGIDARVQALEQEVARLRAELSSLARRLGEPEAG